MCNLFKIRFAQCSHSEQQFIPCQSSFNNANNSWLRRHLFSHLSRHKQACDYKMIDLHRAGICCSCFVEMAEEHQDDDQHQTDDVDDAEEKSRKAYIKYQDEQRAKMEAQTKRFNFQCSMCRGERRNMAPEERDPAINSGLCCARGLDEYHAQEQTKGMYDLHQVPRHGPSPVTDSVAVSRNVLQKRPKTPWPDSKTPLVNSKTHLWTNSKTSWANFMTHRSKKPKKYTKDPPDAYEWETDTHGSAGNRPGSIISFLGAPVTTLNALHLPGRTPSPMINAPGIIWDRWAQMVQTHHGRYPPAECPPSKPVPQVPTAGKENQVQRRTASRSPAGDSYHHPNRGSIPQLEPLRISPFRISVFEEHGALRDSGQSSMGDPPYRPDSRIMVPQFPASQFTRTPSNTPARPLRSVVSNLEEAIDGAIEFWNK